MNKTTITTAEPPTLNASEQVILELRDYLDGHKKPDVSQLIRMVRHNSHPLTALQEIRDLALEAAIQTEYRQETVASSRFSSEGRKTLADVAVEAYRQIKIHTKVPVTWEAFAAPRR
jgi:hypothetical protein